MPQVERKRFWSTVEDSGDEDAVPKRAAAIVKKPAAYAVDHVFDAAHDGTDIIAAHYTTHGFVIVRALTAEACVANIKAQACGMLGAQSRQLLPASRATDL